MSGAALCVLVPVLAAVLAAVLARKRAARWLHVAGCGATLAAVLALAWERPATGWLGDPLALGAAALTALVALGGAVGGLEPAGDVDGTAGGHGAGRFAPAAALALLGSVMLGLLADPVATSWLAVAAAVGVATAAPVLRGTGRWAEMRAMALPAAGALSVSLLGTVLLAAGGAGRWSVLPGAAGGAADGAMLGLGCVLLLAGYALAAGLAPLHGWLGTAQDVAPRELRVLLCAPLPGLALVLLLRAGRVAAAAGERLPAAGLLGFGLLSVVLAGLALWGPGGGRTVRLATVLHGGLAAAAFGLGGSGAVYAGLLHLAVSGLARAAAVLAGADAGAEAGATASVAGAPITTGSGPPAPRSGAAHVARSAAPDGRGWLALLVLLALAGVPPLALFPGEFLLLTQMLARRPALAVVLVAGLVAAALGLLRRGSEGDGAAAREGGLARGAAWALLAAAMLLSLALPSGLSDALTRVAEAFAAQA